MKQRKFLKNGIILVITFLIMLSFSSFTVVKAVNYTNINTNDSWVSGVISTAGEVDYYCIEIHKAGWLTLDYQGQSVRDSYYEILSFDLTKSYHEREVYFSSDISPLNSSVELALEPGKYMIKVRGYGINIGNYRLKTKFMAADNNESSDNNLFTSAQNLSLGDSLVGFLSEDDTVDFYKFSISSRTTVRIVYTSYIGSSYIQLWDKDYIQVYDNNVYTASLEKPITRPIELDLEAGTYYIKIYGDTGKYDLKIEEKIMTKSIAVSGAKTINKGKETRLKATVLPSNTSDKTIMWSSGDSSVAEVDNTGVLKANKPGKVNITVSAQDGSNITKVYTVIVLPSKVSKPYVSKSWFTAGTVNVSWGSDGNVTGYKIQYGTSKKFKGAKTKTVKNSTAISLNKLKRKNYYFRVRSYLKVGKKVYYGKWSNMTKMNMR